MHLFLWIEQRGVTHILLVLCIIVVISLAKQGDPAQEEEEQAAWVHCQQSSVVFEPGSAEAVTRVKLKL